MIRGLIFDFDGVLIESESYLTQIEMAILSRHGILLTEEVVAEYLGYRFNEYIDALEKRFGILLNHDQVAAELQSEIVELYRVKVPLVEHVQQVLSVLHSTYPIALATSRERTLVKMAMARLEIEQYFTSAIYREDVTHGKPDPEVYRKAAESIRLSPSNCVAIEDARSGIMSAKAAGMRTIARRAMHNSTQDFSLADYIVEDMQDIPNILRSL